MKKLSVIFSLFILGFANAQSIKYGATGSLHNGSIAGIHGTSKSKLGGSLGVFADISIVSNDIYDSAWLYLTPQLEFSTIGEKGDWNEDGKNMQTYNNVYVAVPLYIKYYFRSQGYKGDLFIMAGPKLEFLVSEKADEGNAVAEASALGFDLDKFGLGRKMNTFGYGVSVKVGSKINDKMEVFLRFDRGLSKVYSDYTANTAYNRFLSIGLSYYIGETN